MTEEEVLKKWCPFANQGSVSAFRIISPQGAGSGAHTLCIGSACMAWRWKYRQTNRDRTMMGVWPQPDPIYERTGQGYCGLAGASQ
jgi:hypothetical protein